MSSYIKFMFKYLFEPEALPAELLAAGDGPATQRAPGDQAKVDVVFVLDSQAGATGDVSAPQVVVGGYSASSSSQLPVNYSSSSSSSSYFSPSDNMTRPHEASSSSSSSSIMVNKSLVDAAVASTRRLVSSGQGWLQQASVAVAAEQEQPQPQLQSADSGNSKLWPPNCLGFARMFAMAQSSQQQHNAAAAANGTTTTTATTMVSSNSPAATRVNSQGQQLAARLGSFAEFEHLIRQQLAAAARGTGTGNSAGPPSPVSAGPDGNSQRGITSAFYSSAVSSPLALSGGDGSGQQQTTAGSNLLRLLIRSIGHANATMSEHLAQVGREGEEGEQARLMIRPSGEFSTATAEPVSMSWQQHHTSAPSEPATVLQVNSLELLECYNQLQLNDYYQGYDIFIGLRIASTLSILFIVFILFVIYKTGCRDGERTSRSQLRLTSSGGGGDKSGSPVSSASTNSLNKPRLGKRRKEGKYQRKAKAMARKKKKINSTTCGGDGGGGMETTVQAIDPYQTCARDGSFAYNNARADTSGPLKARTNNKTDENQGQAERSWTTMDVDESLIKQQLPSECPSVMVVIEQDDSSATGLVQQRQQQQQEG